MKPNHLNWFGKINSFCHWQIDTKEHNNSQSRVNPSSQDFSGISNTSLFFFFNPGWKILFHKANSCSTGLKVKVNVQTLPGLECLWGSCSSVPKLGIYCCCWDAHGKRNKSWQSRDLQLTGCLENVLQLVALRFLGKAGPRGEVEDWKYPKWKTEFKRKSSAACSQQAWNWALVQIKCVQISESTRQNTSMAHWS